MSLDLTLSYREFNFKVTDPPNNRVFEFDSFRLDAATKLLYKGGEQVILSPKAVETLIALVENRGLVISKQELMQSIWADTIVEESNLAQYLHVLRKTLGEMGDGRAYIETLRRRGYRFNGMVRELVASNGFSTPVEIVQERNAELSNGKPKISNTPHRRVERHGNVLALADWVDNEKRPAALDQKARDQIADRKIFRLIVLAASAIAILLIFLAANWFRSPAENAGQTQAVNTGLTITPLTNAEIVSQATISPDGKYFAYIEFGDDSIIWMQEVGGTSRIRSAELSGTQVICITFTPDSSSIYYLASRKGDKMTTLYRVGALGGVPIKILDGVSSPVSFSPDASEIAFVRQDPDRARSQLLVAASDGSRERSLMTRDGTERIEANPAWSPDGKQIAVGLMSTERSITTCSLIAIDLTGERVKPLSDEKWDSCHRSAWLSDGSGIVFVGTKFKEAVTTRRDQIYLLPVAGDSRRLTNSGNRHEPWSLGITNANEILALPFNSLSQVWSLDMGAEARSARQLTVGQSDGRGGVEALPDGSIFYLARTGESVGIFRINFDDVKNNAAMVSDPTMEELRSSPDGRFLVYAAKTGGYAHLFRVGTDGSDRRQLTFGENNQTDSTVSPDGRWIVYASQFFDGNETHYSLEKIAAEVGDRVQLSNRFCLTPRFSDDGSMVSCIEGEWIHLISPENGETLKTFQAVGVPMLNTGARWTPDGKGLVYRVLEKNVINLWRQPVDGSKAYPITNFSHGDIYNFTFAPDGSRIYLARGNQVRNAVLITNF